MSLALLMCLTFQLQAADVDLAKAQNVARSFMAKQVANGRLRASATSNLKLAKAEPSTFKPDAVDYYIFNADKSYVIVSGDDQAPEILMYGEEGRVDLNNVPPAMQWLLNKYKYQIDGLKAGTLKPNGYTPKATTAVAPLTNANWDQSTPYNNQCPTSGSSRTLTGCPATSLSMCYYVWKWPKTFPAVAAINGSSSGGVSAAALPERTADWDNIIDEYTGPTNKESSNEQKTAVAWLMRYAGQSIPDYMYGTSASGANDPEIYQGVLNMGYTNAKLYTLTELQSSGWGYTNGPQQYTDAQWNEWMLAELHAGNPIEYLAYDCSSYQPAGHAFNVFGCNTSGQYYVNWGWSGKSNGYCTLHNFTTNTGATGQSGSYVFNYGEAMIIGIRPPAGALGPQITVNPTELSFEGFVGETYTKTFTVKGANLNGDITISKQGANCFTVSPTTIAAANAANGVQVTVTYKPTEVGSSNATLTLSSDDADDVTVTLTGNGKPIVPELIADPEELTFRTNPGESQSKSISVLGAYLEGDVTIALTDNAGVFSVNKTTISKDEAEEGADFNVTFNSQTEGTFHGTILLTSPNCDDQVTISLTGAAYEGGTASDAYLNIANYATIDEAGATVSGMSTIYKYTEYPSDACAWLTVSNYGALKADATQNWLTCEGNEKTGNESWSASDVFLGSASYFTGTAYYTDWNEDYQTFYVTNCLQVKQFAENRSNSTYPLKMNIYECTLNDDGTITPSSEAVQTKQNSTLSKEVLASDELDPEKIYKITIFNDYSKLYEIGFKTPIQGIETPVATDATEVTTNSFTANWNACEGATSYTLRVTPKPETTGPELLISENFSAFTDDEGSINLGSSLDDYMQNAGWTGSYVYERAGGLQLGSTSYAGSLTSPQLDLTNSNGKVTVKFKAYSYNSTYSPSTLYLNVNGDTDTQQSVSVPYGTTGTEYTVVLDCNAASAQTVMLRTSARRYRVVLTNVEIYSGDITAIAVTAPALKAEGEMLFPGITDTHYTVTGLEPATTYIYDVKAVYGNKESNWSNQIEVTTLPIVETTLANLESKGVKNQKYAITDELVAVEYKEVGDNNVLLWCKDNNGATPITPAEGVVDFMVDQKVQNGAWDQSNWVVIKTTSQAAGIKAMEAKGKKISGVTGTYVDDVNFMIEVDDFTIGEQATVNLNNYCVANFNSSNWGADGIVQNAVGNEAPNPQRFFFMTPKVQEVCIINYAQWNGEKFVVPVTSGFVGMLNVNYMYNTQDQATVEDLLNSNIKDLEAANYPFYTFTAIVQVPTAGSANLKDNLGNGGTVVYPSNLTADEPSNPTTAISTVAVNGEVKSVKYVNVAGVVSDRPFKGVNIVVTEYTNGTRTTLKMIK